MWKQKLVFKACVIDLQVWMAYTCGGHTELPNTACSVLSHMLLLFITHLIRSKFQTHPEIWLHNAPSLIIATLLPCKFYIAMKEWIDRRTFWSYFTWDACNSRQAYIADSIYQIIMMRPWWNYHFKVYFLNQIMLSCFADHVERLVLISWDVYFEYFHWRPFNRVALGILTWK